MKTMAASELTARALAWAEHLLWENVPQEKNISITLTVPKEKLSFAIPLAWALFGNARVLVDDDLVTMWTLSAEARDKDGKIVWSEIVINQGC